MPASSLKVLIDHPAPFLLAHGGVQVQIEQTKAALEAIGLQAEYVRWWDKSQTGDLIHFFAVPRSAYLKQARLRELPVIATVFLSETCNRPNWKLVSQGMLTSLILRQPFGSGIKEQLNWTAYRLCKHLVVGLEAERIALVKAFGVESSRVSVVPLGLPDEYLKAGSANRFENHLICPGTINAVKRSVELALIAKEADVPILFVGKPYHARDPYWLKFQELIDGRHVKYQAHVGVEDMIRLYQRARGLVLSSQYENWSLVASEAVACGLPLLLPDQKWSRERFGPTARYFPHNQQQQVRVLRDFFEDSPALSPPKVKLHSWREIAKQLMDLYEIVCKSSR